MKGVKTIKSKKTSGRSGASGKFIPLNKQRGIKILINCSYETRKEALQSDEFKEAKAEAAMLKKAYKTGIVPKCYGVCIYSPAKHEYYAGIIMQNLGNTTLSRSKRDDHGTIMEEVEQKLNEFGFWHSDLHSENIMVKGNKFYAIDFDPIHISCD